MAMRRTPAILNRRSYSNSCLPAFMRSGFLARLLNLILYLGFCVLAGTGFLLAFRLPHGSEAARGTTFLGYPVHTWAEAHLWVSYGVLVLLLFHLVLHWKWLVNVAGSRQAWRLAVGLLLGVAIIAFFLIYPLAPAVSGTGQ